MSILVLNTGSSSVKFGLFETDSCDTLASGMIDWAGEARRANLVLRVRSADEIRQQLDATNHRSAVTHALGAMVQTGLLPTNPAEQIRIVGHRVVHGGTMFRDSVRVDENVKTAIGQLADLAPLHNPPALEAIEAAQAALAGTPHVAVFDTAFFADLPANGYVYPLPYEWYSEWGIRRFGFHGISHAYCAGRAAELLPRDPTELRLIICHLGNGCSASAVRGGIAVATTMGFTPLDGLMMGTRPGSVDPGILLYVQRQRGLTPEQLDHTLNYASGLLGVSGVSSDFRQVEAAAREGNERARLALEIYAARVRAAVGSLAVTLGGVDALVFTAGVGENSASLRAAACDGLECLGLQLDPQRNLGCQADADIATAESPARILIIQTREELLIAREARRVAGNITDWIAD